MQQLTTQERERVLYMYQGLKGNVSYYDDLTGYETIINYNHIERWKKESDESDLQVYLKPLDQISKEHTLAIFMRYGGGSGNPMGVVYKDGKRVINWLINNVGIIHPNLYQQLILWGYAVPLYFGFDHYLNSKTAIELGIGIIELQPRELAPDEMLQEGQLPEGIKAEPIDKPSEGNWRDVKEVDDTLMNEGRELDNEIANNHKPGL